MKSSHLTRLLVLITLLALGVVAFAAPYQTINYQGYLKSTAGTPVTTTTSLTFRLYSTSSGSGTVWTESRNVTPVNGVYSIALGEVSSLPLLFNRQYYLGLQVGADPEMRPLQMLMAVPYALRSGCNPGDMLNCYTGPPETLNQGLCKAGVRTCSPDGSGFGMCVGEFIPNCNNTCLDLFNNVANCGACGNVCPAGANGTANCSSGTCGFVCTSGYGDCNGAAGDGCETDTRTSTSNCGGCGTVCPARANGTATCSSSICGFVCGSGFADCNGAAGDGCETDTRTSISNCGACGRACSAVANGTVNCSGGVCGVGVCNAGYANCNGAVVDGCEVNLSTSISNCGTCGRACSAVANGTANCSGGVCGVGGCNTGFADCNGAAGDGCETDIRTSTSNCGACGHACSVVANGTANCSAGVCGVGVCNAGYANCNGNAADGCEVNLSTNNSNCGACGTVCGSGSSCINGKCI